MPAEAYLPTRTEEIVALVSIATTGMAEMRAFVPWLQFPLSSIWDEQEG